MYLKGGFGYGEVEKRLADAADHYLAPARIRREELENHPEKVDAILLAGANECVRKLAPFYNVLTKHAD